MFLIILLKNHSAPWSFHQFWEMFNDYLIKDDFPAILSVLFLNFKLTVSLYTEPHMSCVLFSILHPLISALPQPLFCSLILPSIVFDLMWNQSIEFLISVIIFFSSKISIWCQGHYLSFNFLTILSIVLLKLVSDKFIFWLSWGCASIIYFFLFLFLFNWVFPPILTPLDLPTFLACLLLIEQWTLLLKTVENNLKFWIDCLLSRGFLLVSLAHAGCGHNVHRPPRINQTLRWREEAPWLTLVPRASSFGFRP